MKKIEKKTGILVHGRHLQTKDWERLMWGIPPHKMGSLSKMISIVLEKRDNVGLIVLGTGASVKDGLKEAEYMKRFLLNKIRSNKLGEFSKIKNHPKFQSPHDLSLLKRLMEDIVVETQSQNTIEAVRNAVELFSARDIKEIVHISCGSHISRCMLVQLSMSNIPEDQDWYGVGDDVFFSGSGAEDVVIIEPPHRGDDPMLNAILKPNELFQRYFKISESKNKKKFLEELNTLLGKYNT